MVTIEFKKRKYKDKIKYYMYVNNTIYSKAWGDKDCSYFDVIFFTQFLNEQYKPGKIEDIEWQNNDIDSLINILKIIHKHLIVKRDKNKIYILEEQKI